MAQQPTLTEDEYWDLVEEATDTVLNQFEDEIREYARMGEMADDVEARLEEARVKAVQFSADHPDEAVNLGFRQANRTYLGSIIDHSERSGDSDYKRFISDPDSEYVREHVSEPSSAYDAMYSGALFAMSRDVLDRVQARSDEIIEDEREKAESEQ